MNKLNIIYNNKNTNKQILIFFLFLGMLPTLFGQEVKIDFPEGEITVEAANINIVGYEGTQVIAEIMYEQNRPDLQAGLTRINSQKPKYIKEAEIEYKLKGKELYFDTGRSGRLSLKIPKNLKVICKSHGGNYYYYDGLKLIKIDGVKGEIEISANTSVDVDIKNCTGAISVVTYGNINIVMDKLPNVGLLSLDTYIGHINLSLPLDAAVNLDMKAKKGDIYTNLPLKRKSNKKNAKDVKALLGGGGIDVILNAEAGGDIYLRKTE